MSFLTSVELSVESVFGVTPIHNESDVIFVGTECECEDWVLGMIAPHDFTIVEQVVSSFIVVENFTGHTLFSGCLLECEEYSGQHNDSI